jgi:hypothetical protein
MYLALAILMFAAISCGSPEPVEPTPTPDVPLFAEGEAVALVEAEIAHRRGCTYRKILADVSYATTTASSYLGQGVWAVRSEPFGFELLGNTSFEWG